MNSRDDPAGDVGVDRELVGQLEHRGALGHRSDAAGRRSGRRRPRRSTSVGAVDRHVESVLRPARRSRRPRARPAPRRAGATRGRPARGARRAAAAARSARAGRPPRSMSAKNRPSSNSGAENTAAPPGPMTSEPPQNEIDSSTPTRLQNTTNDVVSWAYVRISVRHEVAVPSPTSFVRARSRPGDDETLTRIWAPSSASSWGVERCQKSSQIASPTPTPSRDGAARSWSPGGEEPPLVEQPVGRQEAPCGGRGGARRPRAGRRR